MTQPTILSAAQVQELRRYANEPDEARIAALCDSHEALRAENAVLKRSLALLANAREGDAPTS